MPRTHGDGLIHVSEIDYATKVNDAIPEHQSATLSDVELKIGRHCAGLTENGATLQVGIGNIPDAVLASLSKHKNLGIHTEMFSDGLIPLIESGVVNNSKKKIHPGKVVASFAMGTRTCTTTWMITRLFRCSIAHT
jgi:acyl-CoA hydrolase